MSEYTAILRHRHICDLCYKPIKAGELCRIVRDDFWPMQLWYEHIDCKHRKKKSFRNTKDAVVHNNQIKE